MNNKLEADVVVVGAGTAGCYFAWQLGKAGYKVLILEAKNRKSSDLFGKCVFYRMEHKADFIWQYPNLPATSDRTAQGATS